jgi:hypothetical protein
MSIAYLFSMSVFQLFYNIHIIAFIGLIPISFIHSARVTPIASSAWAVDLLLRFSLPLSPLFVIHWS